MCNVTVVDSMEGEVEGGAAGAGAGRSRVRPGAWSQEQSGAWPEERPRAWPEERRAWPVPARLDPVRLMSLSFVKDSRAAVFIIHEISADSLTTRNLF